MSAEIEPMTEELARKILVDEINGDELKSIRYLAWFPGEQTATLDDRFTADELEAIAWWMRHHQPDCSTRISPEKSTPNL